LDDLGIEGRAIWHWILNKWTGWVWDEFTRLRSKFMAMKSIN
jgi:hypothetical protein